MFENVLEGVRNDTFQMVRIGFAFHSKGFARTGLAIGENGAIVSAQYTVNHTGSTSVVDILLFHIGAEDMIETESLGAFTGNKIRVNTIVPHIFVIIMRIMRVRKESELGYADNLS